MTIYRKIGSSTETSSIFPIARLRMYTHFFFAMLLNNGTLWLTPSHQLGVELVSMEGMSIVWRCTEDESMSVAVHFAKYNESDNICRNSLGIDAGDFSHNFRSTKMKWSVCNYLINWSISENRHDPIHRWNTLHQFNNYISLLVTLCNPGWKKKESQTFSIQKLIWKFICLLARFS